MGLFVDVHMIDLIMLRDKVVSDPFDYIGFTDEQIFEIHDTPCRDLDLYRVEKIVERGTNRLIYMRTGRE